MPRASAPSESLSIIRSGPIRVLHQSANPPQRPAVFLDRDGTLIEHVPYLDDPTRVRLLPSTGEALRRLADAGFARVLVTNQSGIGRGRITHECVEKIHWEVQSQLAEQGASLDAVYYCPLVPSESDRTRLEHPDRKPGPGMLLRAARDLSLDLATSWMVGDLISDALAGHYARCRGSILVRTGIGNSCRDNLLCPGLRFCDDLLAAATLIVDDRAGRLS